MIYVQVLLYSKQLWDGTLPAVPRQGDHIQVDSRLYKVNGVHWNVSERYDSSPSRPHGLNGVKVFVSGPFS